MQDNFLAAADTTKQLLRERGVTPLFLSISGSHACGLARPDSDIDIRGIYLEQTRRLLAWNKPKDTIEISQGILDIQCYEIEKFLHMLAKHNGNAVRMLTVPLVVYEDKSIPWQALGEKYITKQLRFYYRGYANSQRKRAMSQRGGRALVYCYRELFEGIGIALTGKQIHNFMDLWHLMETSSNYTSGLLYKYFPDPKQDVSDEGWRQFYTEWEDLCVKLDHEMEISNVLPKTYDGETELEDILTDLRWCEGMLDNYSRP